MRAVPVIAAVAVLAGCSRDFTLPEPTQPQPGALFGRVVVAVPGKTQRQPAPGAELGLLGSSLSATASTPEARFSLTGIDQSEGKVLFRYAGDGHLRQKLISLAEVGAGLNRQVSLGDVLLAENASVMGRALRGEIAQSHAGHRGTVVFVPEGPYLSYTADDGSFVFDELPEGSIELGVFRTGYKSVVLPSLALRGGELLTLRDLVLVPDPNPMPGDIEGTLRFVPALADAASATVTARALDVSLMKAGTVAADGSFTIAALPPGLYAVEARQPGYTPTTTYNVLVSSAQTTSLALVLGQGPALDAGMPQPLPDGGPVPDAGGFDGGTADAGITDGGADAGPQQSFCTQQMDCPLTQWCDDGLCVPQCGASAPCTNGRFCDPGTHTCVTPCTGGCDGGSSCDLATNACRPLCDGSHLCAPGFVCNGLAYCEPECSVTRPCPTHRTCQAGQCAFDQTCESDLDCPRWLMCTGFSCIGRPTDAGVNGRFPCGTSCDCRGDEMCADGGSCEIVPAPTMFFAPDGGGDGGLPGQASKDLNGLVSRARRGDLVALLATPTLLSGALDVDGGVTVAGGYVDCGPWRWVRNDAQRTPIQGDTQVVAMQGTLAAPHEDITLRNLAVTSTSIFPIWAGIIEVSNVPRLTLENVSGATLAGMSFNSVVSLIRCNACPDLKFTRVEVAPSPTLSSAGDLWGVRLTGVSGVVDGFTLAATNHHQVKGLYVSGLTGPLTIKNSQLGAITAGAERWQISVDSCASWPLTVVNNSGAWPLGLQNYATVAYGITDCPKSTVSGNVIDGRAQTGPFAESPTGVEGLRLQNSGGTASDNRFWLPIATGQYSAITPVSIIGTHADWDIHHNVSDGGSLPYGYGVQLSFYPAQTGTLRLHDNDFSLNAARGSGMKLSGISVTNAAQIVDNRISFTSSSSGDVKGIDLENTVVLLERNRVELGASGGTTGLFLTGGFNQVEAYDNVFVAGPAFSPNSGFGSFAVDLSAGQLWATGNTFEARPDPTQSAPMAAVRCGQNAKLFASSNIFGGGARANPVMIEPYNATSSCVDAGSFDHNYFWHAYAGPRGVNDAVDRVVFADAGTFDSNGNIYAVTASCFAGPTDLHLSPTSQCIDTGVSGLRRDGSPILLDLERTSRKKGAQADIGALEKQ